MNDNFKIILQALIDESSLSDIQKRLAKERLKISVDIDLTNFTKNKSDIEKQLQALSTIIKNILGNTVSDKQATQWAKSYVQTINSEFKKISKIQLSFANGNALSQVEQLTAKFKNLGYTEDEIGQKMQSVTAAFSQLQTAISSGDNRSIVAANEQFNSSLKQTSNLYRQIKADSTSYYDTAKQTKLSNDIQNWMSKNTAATKQAKASLSSFLTELSNGRINVSRLKEIQAQFQQIDTQMRSIERLGKSFRQTFMEGMKKFSYWTSSTFLVMKTIQEIKQAVTSVKELDTALVDLKKTSTMTASQLNEFYYSANDAAKKMGVTTKQIIEQSSAWSRLGYSSNEAATQMAKYSSMFASISPGMNINRATDGLVSVMKAFKIETDDVLDGIMSKINIIGNNKALSNSDIIEFLTRSSSAMAEANNSLQETIALGEAAIEITRDAASVGQVLKTTSMRIRSYDEDTESYTEDLENLKGEIASLTKTASTPGGISLFTDDTKETYKSTYEILKEISAIWDDLTDKNQAKLLETLAGKRNGQALAAIISNFDSARESMELMKNSAGNAEAEMSIIMDSLDYKLNRFKETGTGIAQNLFQRDDMKNIVDGLTGVANIIDAVTSKLGLIGTLTVGAGITAFIRNLGCRKVLKNCLDF